MSKIYPTTRLGVIQIRNNEHLQRTTDTGMLNIKKSCPTGDQFLAKGLRGIKITSPMKGFHHILYFADIRL